MSIVVYNKNAMGNIQGYLATLKLNNYLYPEVISVIILCQANIWHDCHSLFIRLIKVTKNIENTNEREMNY